MAKVQVRITGRRQVTDNGVVLAKGQKHSFEKVEAERLVRLRAAEYVGSAAESEETSESEVVFTPDPASPVADVIEFDADKESEAPAKKAAKK